MRDVPRSRSSPSAADIRGAIKTLVGSPFQLSRHRSTVTHQDRQLPTRRDSRWPEAIHGATEFDERLVTRAPGDSRWL
jgi:hypothetical protein